MNTTDDNMASCATEQYSFLCVYLKFKMVIYLTTKGMHTIKQYNNGIALK